MATAQSSGPGILPAWLDALRALSAAVAARGDIEPLLTRVAATACTLLGFEFCAVFLPDASRSTLLIGGAAGLSPDYIVAVNEAIRISVGGPAPASRAFVTGHAVTVSDIDADRDFAPWGEQALKEGFRSLAAVPLIADGESIGTLTGYHRDEHDFTTEELQQMSHLADHASIAVVSAQTMGSLRAANAELIRQQHLVARSEEIHQRFLAVALSFGGVDGIAATLATLLQRPVLIEDSNGSELAARRVPRSFASAQFRKTLVRGNDPLAPTRHEDGQMRLWSSTVRLVDEPVARLWVEEGARTLDDLDIRAIEHATLATALEMMRQRNSAETEHRHRAELVNDLLSGVSGAQMTDRARHLGHDLSLPHLAMVAQPAAVGAAGVRQLNRAFDAVTSLVPRENPPRPLAAIHGGALVVLWPLTSALDQGEADQHVERVCEHVRQLAGPLTIVLTSALNPRSPAHALRVALGALRIARRAGREDALIRLPELGLGGLLLQVEDPTQLIAFVNDRLDPIIRYDEMHGTDLVATLATHILGDLNVAGTAAGRRVHPNTVRQRLHRIQQLTGADLSRPDALLEFTTAFTIRDVLMTP